MFKLAKPSFLEKHLEKTDKLNILLHAANFCSQAPFSEGIYSLSVSADKAVELQNLYSVHQCECAHSMDVSLCIDTFPLRVSMCARGCKYLSVLVAIHSLYLAVQQCESATQEFRPLVNTFIFDNFELTFKCKTLLCKYQFKPHSSTSDMLLSCHSDCDPNLNMYIFLYSCVYSGLQFTSGYEIIICQQA